MTTNAKPIALTADETKARTPFGDAWVQFKKNKMAVISLIFIIFMVLLAISADFWQSVGMIDDPNFQHKGTGMSYASPMTCTIDIRRLNPSWCFVGGTDGLGRDLFSRAIYGARISFAVGAVGAATTMIVGVTYGIIAGFYGGRIDNVMMRFVDFLYAIPGLPLIILFQTFFKTLSVYPEQAGPIGRFMLGLDKSMGGLLFLFIVIGLLSWIGVSRLARGQTLSTKNKEFVESARAIGARNRRIIFVHILPNILGPLVIVAATSVPGFIGTETTLSYLGLGINPPTPSWGDMIAEAQSYGFASAQHLVLVPGIFFTLTVLAFNYLGDGLRDALDPSLRGS